MTFILNCNWINSLIPRCTKKSLAAAKKSETTKAGPPTSRSGRVTQSGRSTGGAGASAGQTDRGGRSRSPEERAVSPKLVPAESSSAVPSSSRAKVHIFLA